MVKFSGIPYVVDLTGLYSPENGEGTENISGVGSIP